MLKGVSVKNVYVQRLVADRVSHGERLQNADESKDG